MTNANIELEILAKLDPCKASEAFFGHRVEWEEIGPDKKPRILRGRVVGYDPRPWGKREGEYLVVELDKIPGGQDHPWSYAPIGAVKVIE